MAMTITNDCINCGACEAECPGGAVMPKMETGTCKSTLFLKNVHLVKEYVSFEHFYIDPRQCNNCQGVYSSPRCSAVCPVACCLSDEMYMRDECVSVRILNNPVYISKIGLN